MENAVEVNGKLYQKRERKTPSYLKSRSVLTVMAMVSLFGVQGSCVGGGGGERPNVDIVKEYGLIELKKSNLSRSQRDWVVSQFKRNYEEINETNDNNSKL